MHIQKPSHVLILMNYLTRAGRHILTVTVGYAQEADGTLIDEAPFWAWLAPRFSGMPFDVSLKKMRGTFAVSGQAFAPGGVPVTAMTVAAGVGPISKQLLVTGDRTWVPGILGFSASKPQAFSSMPLDLAHAFGGEGCVDNPYGKGYAKGPDAQDILPLPNIEYAKEMVLAISDRPTPATFLPLPETVRYRSRWLGHFDKRWEKQDFPFYPMDTDERFFDAVSEDQCLTSGYFTGNETWWAEGMHPQLPRVSGRLPGLRPRLFGRSKKEPATEFEARLTADTVWLFPDASRVLVLYRAEVEVADSDASDIDGMALFTEYLTDTPEPAESLCVKWREMREPPAKVDPMPMAALQVELDNARVEIAAAQAKIAQLLTPRIEGELTAAREKAYRQAGVIAARSGQALPKQLPPIAWNPQAVTAPVNRATLSANVNAELRAARQQGEALARKQLKAVGLDADTLMAVAKAKPAGAPNPLAAIAALNVPSIVKSQLATRMQGLLGKMAGIESQLAAMTTSLASQSGAVQSAHQVESEVAERLAASGVDTRLGESIDLAALLARRARGESLVRLHFQQLDFSGFDFANVDFSGSTFEQCTLVNSCFRSAILNGVVLKNCDADGADFSGITARALRVNGGSGHGASLRGAQLSEVRFETTSWSQADLSEVRADKALFMNCDMSSSGWQRGSLEYARFTECQLSAANFSAARVERAKFDSCVLDRTHFNAVCGADTSFWTVRGIDTQFVGAQLPGLRIGGGSTLLRAVFDQAVLLKASFQHSALHAVGLREAQLDDAYVADCDLTGSNAWRVRACGANFSGCRLIDANWRGANLMKASLRKTVLERLDLTGSNLFAVETQGAIRRAVDVRQALLTRCRILEEGQV